MKHVFIINGSGNVGKDTICATAARYWRVRNISSVTPVLALARAAGWRGEKSPQARLFLFRLKQACMAFNDLPFRYCMEQYESFLQSEEELLFVHIREPEEITRFRQAVSIRCDAILVRRPVWEEEQGRLGNPADDQVEQYPYDGIFVNDGTLEQLPEQVYQFLTKFL